MSDTALVVGATSSLAVALCRQLAERGWRLVLCGRDREELALLAADLEVRSTHQPRVVEADLASADFSAETLADQVGTCGAVLVAAGDMGEGEKESLESMRRVIAVNFTAPAQILEVFARRMQEDGGGAIVAISSVAGDRGRQSNYLYGSAKAGLTAFASGLRNRMFGSGVRVMTVKPGFVDTPMTWGMESPLIAPREAVAARILDAMEKGVDVLYVPWFWRWIMCIIRHIPEFVFKRLGL